MNGNAHVSRVDEPIPLLDCTYNGRFAGLARDLVRAEPHRGHGDTALAAARCSCQARSSQSHRRAVGKMAGQTSHPLLSVTFAASVSVESAAMSLDAVQTPVVVETEKERQLSVTKPVLPHRNTQSRSAFARGHHQRHVLSC